MKLSSAACAIALVLLAVSVSALDVERSTVERRQRVMAVTTRGTLGGTMGSRHASAIRVGVDVATSVGEESGGEAPLYVLPMVPGEWKQGNLITNPFMNAIDQKVLDNGWTPGMEAAAKGLSPNPTGPADQTGVAVQPSFLEVFGNLQNQLSHTFTAEECNGCSFL